MSAHEKGIDAAQEKIWRVTYGDFCIDCDAGEQVVRAYLEASGQVLVPKIPTDEMTQEGMSVLDGGWNGRTNAPDANASRLCWLSMLAAAPQPFSQDNT